MKHFIHILTALGTSLMSLYAEEKTDDESSKVKLADKVLELTSKQALSLALKHYGLTEKSDYKHTCKLEHSDLMDQNGEVIGQLDYYVITITQGEVEKSYCVMFDGNIIFLEGELLPSIK